MALITERLKLADIWKTTSVAANSKSLAAESNRSRRLNDHILNI